ncbi:MAG: nucleoside deaminase [Candidatus Cloacimonadota bacterium]|nr:MAG: nucleoside deaminase [Candidatus Cloacimonadota bacterium]
MESKIDRKMKSSEDYITKTYELAKHAQAKGNHPFGALLVIDGKIVLTAENTVITDNDITKHAELNLVSAASRKFDAESLSRSVLYTSTEPCAMCTGAIFWAGIPTIVYGCSAEKLGEIAGGSFVVPSRELLRYGKRKIEVIGPILEKDGSKIHQNFWK